MDRAVPYILAGLLAIALLVVLSAVAVRGFGELDSGPDPVWGREDEWAGTPTDPAFVYVEPITEPASPPPPPWVGLPHSVMEATEVLDHPLRVARLRAHLSVGSALAREAVLSSIRAMRDDGGSDLTLEQALGPVVLGHPTPAHCAWLREQLGRPSPPLYRSFFAALATCEDPESVAMLLDPDAPSEVREPFVARFPWLVADPRPPLPELVASPRVPLDLLRARTSDEARLTRALVRCATAPPDEALGEERAAECLASLAASSPAVAVQAARSVERRGPELPYLREQAHVLTHDLAGGRLEERLRDLDLILDEDVEDPAVRSGVAARDVLARFGRALCFERHAGWPPGDDGLLVRLAWLARPLLDDVSFDETERYPGSRQFLIHAYAGGYDRSTDARAVDGSYDTYSAVGLMNALLRDRYSDVRIAWLDQPDTEMECLVAGSQQGLLTAENESLLTLDDPPEW